MKQLKLTFLLSVLMSMVGAEALAYNFKVDGICYVFYDGSSVEVAANSQYSGNIVIPSTVDYNGKTYNVVRIGYRAFAETYHLESITIPLSVTSIGDYAFSGSLITAIDIPSSVVRIGDYVFNKCKNLTSITIPSSVRVIGEGVFCECQCLTRIVVDSGNTIYDSRNNCNAVVETGTNTIVHGCCRTIIPNSVTAIGDYAFIGCQGLRSIEIPSSVINIGSMAFHDCTALTSVKIGCIEPIAIGNYTFSNRTNATLYVPVGCKTAYEAADYWKEFKEIVEVAVEPFQEVASHNISFMIMPDNNYSWSGGVDIPIDNISETLGTSDWVVYGLNTLDENGKEREGNDKYSKDYTFSPSPGFWLNSDGRNAGWGDPDAKFGITVGGYQSGKLNIIQYPNRCTIGDVLNTKLFFVNEDNSEMVTLTVTCNVVSAFLYYEEVGAQNLVIPISKTEGRAIDFDFAPAAEALGVSVNELTAESSRYLKGFVASVFSEGVNIQTGLSFDANGEFDAQGDYYFWFESGKMYTGTMTNIPEDFSLPVCFAFNIGNKIYVYNAVFVSTANYYLTGSIGTNKIPAYWYNLNSSESGNKEIHAYVTVPNTQNDDCAFEYDILSSFDGNEVQLSVDEVPSMFTDIAVTAFRFTTPSATKGNATFDADSNGRWTVTGASGATYTLCVSMDGMSIQTTSGVTIVQLMGDNNNIAEYQNNTTALDILNYAGHLQLGSRETFTAYVEMVVESSYDLVVTDNSQYFNVRFLRPVDVTATDGVVFSDEGEAYTANVMDLVSLNDWRGHRFTTSNAIADYDGELDYVNYITYSTPHYINYYEVIVSADVNNAYTDVEGIDYNFYYLDAPITWNGNKLVGGTLVYVSNNTPNEEFHIYVPITITYKWGTYQTLGVITVSSSDTGIEDITSRYIDNAGFDEDLTWQVDGSKKEIIDQTNVLSNRSIAGIAADNSVYALVNPATPNRRPDGRTLEAANGFIGQVRGWENVNNQAFPKCEWVYFGTIPYDLQAQAIPIADDGSTYQTVPCRPAVANGDDNIGFVYFRAGWGARAVYKQTVNLPKAKYCLEYWSININPNASNGTNLAKVTSNDVVYEDESSLNDTQWVLHTIIFDADGETSIELGFESSGGSGSNPFLCIDGVKLLRIGESTLNNTIKAVSQSLIMGKTSSMSMNLTNEDEMIAFEFDLQLPNGISIAKDEDGDPIGTLSSRASQHSLAVSDKGNGLYHFLGYSNDNRVINGNEGELLSIELFCDENMAVGTYQATIKNIIFSDVDKNKITLPDYSFDIKVIDAVPGDVNNDGDINVMDVVEMVAYIMGDGSPSFVFSAADLYPDGTINVMDLVNLVELIMHSSSSSAPQWTDEGMSLSTQDDGTISVKVKDAGQYVASEFIVEVGVDQQLEAVTADMYHSVTISKIDDSHYKVMTYSNKNSKFKEGDAFVTLHVSGEGIVTVKDALLVDESRQGVAFAPTDGGYTTGIKSLTPDPSPTGEGSVYSLSGQRVSVSSESSMSSVLPKGVYIVNGKKKVVK